MAEAHSHASPRRRGRASSKGRSRSSSATRPIRVWCPGPFDTLHFGHVSFLRKVKEQMIARFPKVEIVVGLCSDEELAQKEEQPVFTLNERHEMIRGNKWVDEIVKGAPCQLSKEVLKKFNCDYAFRSIEEAEEEDELTDFERQLRQELLECGLLKFLMPSKSEYPGISSSDIVNRMLLLEERDENNNTISGHDWNPKKLTFPNGLSCKEIFHFADWNVPKKGDKIVYVDGSFDLLHPGHVRLLEKARELGDFLYVGLHSDDAISKYAGERFPVMNWSERLMSLLACKYVSEVVIDAPVGVNDSIIKAFSVNVVVRSIEDYVVVDENANAISETDMNYKYKDAIRKGIFHDLHSSENPQEFLNLTTATILKRVHDNWPEYNYVLCNKSSTDLAGDLDRALAQRRDDGDVVKFS